MSDLFRPVELTGNAVIDSLIGGGAWNTARLTYGFKAQDIDRNGIQDFEEGDWKAFYGEIFSNVSTFAKLDFSVAPAAQANLVQRLDVGGGGESGGPGPGVTTIETAVGIDPTSVKGGADIVRLGTYSEVWFHEVGHSLGLKHTHDADAAGPLLPGVTDPDDKGAGYLNSQIYSVMGYTYDFWGEDNPFTPQRDFNVVLNAQPGSFGAIDIAALQAIYGARTYHATNSVYRFSDDVDANDGYTTIWDTGGTDTIAYEGTSRAKIDLRAATLKAEIGGGGWLSTSQTLTGGFTIANGVTIERAIGGSADDILIGNGAANRLDGGAGADGMTGGAGNDVFVVDSSRDRIVEAARGGEDTVLAKVDYRLAEGQEIETVTAFDTSSKDGLALTGNRLANTLRGTAGDDRLDGGAGADALHGGAGDDSYVVDTSGDLVLESARGGQDGVASSVSYTLRANIENLTLTGTKAFAGFGNTLANDLVGNAGANRLDGGLGHDTLSGGDGADRYVFSTRLDARNVDHITDFDVASGDAIVLDGGVFAGLKAGGLSVSAFKSLGAGVRIDRDDRILYDKATGTLSFDADGSGQAFAATTFAILDDKVALTAHDIFVV